MSGNSIKSNLYTWPSFKPIWRRVVLLVSCLIAIFAFVWQVNRALNSLQLHYLGQYAKASFADSIAPRVTIQYRFVDVMRADGFERIALPSEVQIAGTREVNNSYQLCALAHERGFVSATKRAGTASAFAVHAALKKWIYPDIDFAEMIYRAFGFGALAGIIGIPFAIVHDRKRMAYLKKGRRIEGAEILAAKEYCRRHPAGSDDANAEDGGLEFWSYEQRWQAFGFTKIARYLITVDRALEDKHFLYLGDTGNGKSVLIKRNLQQIDERGEFAIVYDPGAQFLPVFLQCERGDVVLNPFDARFPNWQLRNEVHGPADAHLIAKSLFPAVDLRNKFFEDASRKIFEHLILARPGNAELVQWLSTPREIESRVRGTEMASMIDSRAGEQRAGVLASLGMVADSLRLLPAASAEAPAWSIAEWAKQRKGWAFITSTHLDRDIMRPLATLWMDLLIARSMTELDASKQKAWFVFDEAASLGYMPALATLLTEGRKANCSVVLATQSHTDLKVYGDKAEAMLSQPKTKIILGVSGVESSKWASQQLGNVKIVRYRDSRSIPEGTNMRQSTSHQQEIVVEPLVMDSVIAGLPALQGYLKCGNEVVRLEFPYTHYREIAPAFIGRDDAAKEIVTPKDGHASESHFFE